MNAEDIAAMKLSLEAHQISLANLRLKLADCQRNSVKRIRDLEWELEEARTALRLARHREDARR